MIAVGLLIMQAMAPATAHSANLPLETQGRIAIADPAANETDQPHVRTLANGFRYVIVPRRSLAPQDAKRVSFRLHVEGGWLAEASGESGLVHLIEHVETEGSKNFTAADLIKLRDGMTVGSEWGAWTSPRATEYFFTSINNDTVTTDRLMMFLTGILQDLTFNKAAVDRQRQIVANEMASRRAVDTRQFERAHVLDPGSVLDRAQGYTSTDVATASIDTIERLYSRVYRPENTTLSIVGDVDVPSIDRLIHKYFAGWVGKSASNAYQQQYRPEKPVVDDRGRVSFNAQPTGVATVIIRSANGAINSEKMRVQRTSSAMNDRVLTQIVNQRLEIQTLGSGLPKAAFSIESGSEGSRAMQLEQTAGSDDWRTVLNFLLRQIAILSEHGFSDREVTVARRGLLRQLADEQDWALYDTNSRIGERTITEIASGQRVQTAERAYRQSVQAVDSVSVQSVTAAWRAMWDKSSFRVRVESKSLASLRDPAASIVSVVNSRRAGRRQVSDSENRRIDEYLAYKPGKPGVVRSDASLANGTRRVMFANGTVLTLIKRLHQGKWLEVAIDVGAPDLRKRFTYCDSIALPILLGAGGAKRQSTTGMREAIMGQEIHFSPLTISSDGISTSASVRKEEIKSAILFLHAILSDPGFRVDGTRAARAQLRERLDHKLDDPTSALLGEVQEALAGIRTGKESGFDTECVGNATMTRTERLLGSVLSKGVLNIAIAGNFEQEDMVALVSRTFGGLAKRQVASANGADGGKAPVPSLSVAGPKLSDKQVVYGHVWDLGDVSSAHDRAIQQMFVIAFSRLLYARLVEQEQLTYALKVDRIELAEWSGRPALFTASIVSASRVDQLASATAQVVDQVRGAPIAPEALEIARRISLDGVTASYNDDRVWAFQAVQPSGNGNAVTIWRGLEREFPTVTAAELKAYANRVLSRQLLTIR